MTDPSSERGVTGPLREQGARWEQHASLGDDQVVVTVLAPVEHAAPARCGVGKEDVRLRARIESLDRVAQAENGDSRTRDLDPRRGRPGIDAQWCAPCQPVGPVIDPLDDGVRSTGDVAEQ